MFNDLKARIAQHCLFLKRNFPEDTPVNRQSGAGSCFTKPAVDELDNIDNMTIEELQALQSKLDQEFEQRKMEQQKINELLEKSQFNSISDEELMKELEGLQGGRKRAKKPLKKGTQ
jgi:predicted XRE-type DNA-binding protein